MKFSIQIIASLIGGFISVYQLSPDKFRTPRSTGDQMGFYGLYTLWTLYFINPKCHHFQVPTMFAVIRQQTAPRAGGFRAGPADFRAAPQRCAPAAGRRAARYTGSRRQVRVIRRSAV